VGSKCYTTMCFILYRKSRITSEWKNSLMNYDIININRTESSKRSILILKSDPEYLSPLY
jgi:hypothetical protein